MDYVGIMFPATYNIMKIDVLNLFFLDNVTVASFNFMFSHSY